MEGRTWYHTPVSRQIIFIHKHIALSKCSTDLIFKWTFIYLYAYIIHPMYASADIKIRNYRNYLNTIQLCLWIFGHFFLFYFICVVICCCCLFALVCSSVVWFIFLCFEYHVSRFRRSWFRSFLLRTKRQEKKCIHFNWEIFQVM